MTQVQTSSSPELKPLANIYWLPERLEGDWDALNREFTDPVWGSLSPQKMFDGGIDVADYGNGHSTYVGYVRNRAERVLPSRPALYGVSVGDAAGFGLIRKGTTSKAIPGGPAIFVAETEGIEVVGRANIYQGVPPSGGDPVPYVGFFRDYGGRDEIDRDVQRLILMNRASLKMYGVELHSEPHPSELSSAGLSSAWHELATAGMAEAMPMPTGQHYRFIGHQLVA